MCTGCILLFFFFKQKTAYEMRISDWSSDVCSSDLFMLTGDQGCMDADGFIRFVGRDDDVITSAGYRIGPGPIEDCLLGHPSVHMAAVVGEIGRASGRERVCQYV